VASLHYLPVYNFWLMALVNLTQAAMLAPLATLIKLCTFLAARGIGSEWLELLLGGLGLQSCVHPRCAQGPLERRGFVFRGQLVPRIVRQRAATDRQ
jgi:hypothetical protein